MEYRIEQLARAAGVAVDTIRFYQGKGLLEPPRRDGRVTWYGDGHLERLRRIRPEEQPESLCLSRKPAEFSRHGPGQHRRPHLRRTSRGPPR